MLSFPGSLKVFVALEPCDMRAGPNTLGALVNDRLKEETRNGALFVFSNKRWQQLPFNIPIRHRNHRLPVASIARATFARGPSKGTERDRGH